MSESMFGRPLQHLLPSNPSASAVSSEPANTAPVRAATPTFKDFRFNSIGKQPELLSRISLPQQDHTDYHSPTPSPTSTPPPPSVNDRPQPSSRPTLLQQLATSSMDGDSRLKASGSLASRIQMTDSPSSDNANATHGVAAGFPSFPLHVTTVRPAMENANLIPPVEVLSQPPDSSPPSPTSPLQQVDMHSPTSSSPLMNATTIRTSQVPTPTAVVTNITSGEPAVPSSSLTSIHAMMQDLQPSPSSTASIDSLVARQEHLHSISARLANLAPPLAPPSSQSPPPDPLSVSLSTTSLPNQSQRNSVPIILRHPYSANQPSGLAGLGISVTSMNTIDPSLALVPSPTAIAQEHQTQNRVIIEAFQNLNSVLNAAHHAQMDSVKALELRMQVFDEQRAAFEQVKRMDEAALQQEFQELRQKREELNAKEASLASLEKERRAREEARKGVLAKRQAQEEEKRAAEAKRVQNVQEQIENAMKELKEIEALKAKCQVGQRASEDVQNDLPTQSMDGMDEEETAVIKSRNDLLCAVKHLRRMLTDKVHKLEESSHTLHNLEEQRKRRGAEEVEHRRIVEEERLRAQAEMERVRQAEEERRRELEVEKRRQEVEKHREQARLLVEQQAHAEAQVHGAEATSSHARRSEEVSALQQQGTAETTRARASGEKNSPGTANAMDVDNDGTAFTPRLTLSDAHPSPRGSQSATPQAMQKKNDKPISGGVMLAKPNDRHVPPKSSAVAPSLSSPNHVAQNAPARTTPAIPVSAENRPKSSVPARVVSGQRRADGDIHTTSDRKPAFSRPPKSQTVLDATRVDSQELNIGPLSGLSPAQQTANLRHLMRVRGHVEGNDNGDRSARTVSLKSEDNSILLKREEQDDQSHKLVQGSLSNNPLLPPRPGVIPPPRPPALRKRHHEVPASQTAPSNPRPTESSGMALTRRELNEQPRDAPTLHTASAPVQLPTLLDATKSLLLSPVEPQAIESRPNVAATQDHENLNTSVSEPALIYELDGEDLPRDNRRFPEEPRRARNSNGARRMPDHYSPPSQPTVTSPTQPHRLIDSWRPQNPSNGPRAEPMRATPPTTGRKRPSEFSDNEHGHRARRQRGDVWIAQDHDRDRVETYRPQWDRRLDTEPDERRTGYRAPGSPPDRIRPYPGAAYDDRTYVPPAPEEPTAPAARWEQPYRRTTENGESYQRYQSSAPGYNAMSDQHHADDTRVGQTYEPMVEERMEVRPDPSLLARMHDTQRFQPRGRGRGEPSRARGDFGRGRGRGAARTGPSLIDRLTSGPSSLEDRLM